MSAPISFEDGIVRLSAATGYPAQELQAYADEDGVGGYNTNPSYANFPMGSAWEVEGKLLYALVRASRPTNVLEIGTAYGCTATHILAALAKNDWGHLTSVDIDAGSGSRIPYKLRDRWVFIAQDAIQFLKENTIPFEMIFEDGLHTYEFTLDVLKELGRAMPNHLIAHDAEHFSIYGENVRRAWGDFFGAYSTMLMAPSDCGLAYWVKNVAPARAVR